MTDEGQTYLGEVTACLNRLEHAHEQLKGFQDRAAGPVRALIQETFCKNYVMRDMADFLARYPEIDLEVHLQEHGGDPLLGGYDVSVQSDEPRNNSYIVRKLGKVPIILAASPEYLAVRGAPRTPADLDAHECIRLGNTLEGAMTWRLAPRANPSAPLPFKPQGRCFFSGQFDAVIFAAASGVGIAPVDIGAAMKYLERGQLKIVLPDYELVGVELFLIYPHRERLPMRTRVFIDFIADVAARRLSPTAFDPLAYAA